MINVGISVVLAALGAIMGSFACCQVWRLRKGDKSKWSHCMHCKYQLKWYDNLPVISWLVLGGKCRKCKKPIGAAEILSEVGLAAVFALSFLWWPWQGALLALDAAALLRFVLFLALLVALTILFIYDLRWTVLPEKVLYIAIGIAAAYWLVGLGTAIIEGQFEWQALLDLAGAIMILPLLYFLMYKMSKEQWVGGGDWLLCLALALMLGSFWLGMFCLFASNTLGVLGAVPALFKKKGMAAKIPFGPFLIVGFWLVFMWQIELIHLVTI